MKSRAISASRFFILVFGTQNRVQSVSFGEVLPPPFVSISPSDGERNGSVGHVRDLVRAYARA